MGRQRGPVTRQWTVMFVVADYISSNLIWKQPLPVPVCQNSGVSLCQTGAGPLNSLAVLWDIKMARDTNEISQSVCLSVCHYTGIGVLLNPQTSAFSGSSSHCEICTHRPSTIKYDSLYHRSAK